ncbi:MAG: Gfo/Idh/MocA family oxidoreductase [Eubacterium sp.]|nr:Gfo/Idh/MocA family oxidoreductase [Eubacterium sp.]
MKKMKIGIVGCGDISGIYMKNLQTAFADRAEVIAVAARTMSNVEKKAAQYGIPKALTVDELMADPDIELVLNLTIPAAHYEINKKALLVGKHVYSEKPLAIELEDGQELLALAAEKGLMIGCAPDTVMGGALQLCRHLIEESAIGKPLSAEVTLHKHGPESEHPAPAFLYQHGAGPVFDYGPYYLSALVSLLGPVREVCTMSGKGFETRTCTVPGPNEGVSFPVEVPTHVTGTALLESGALATITFSFDRWTTREDRMVIYGTEGTLYLGNPDQFGDTVRLMKADESEPSVVQNELAFNENSRGLGVWDMIGAIEDGRKPVASGTIALHVLEIMHALIRSGEEKRFVKIESACSQPPVFQKG